MCLALSAVSETVKDVVYAACTALKPSDRILLYAISTLLCTALVSTAVTEAVTQH